jgi:hypothetical protein
MALQNDQVQCDIPEPPVGVLGSIGQNTYAETQIVDRAQIRVA